MRSLLCTALRRATIFILTSVSLIALAAEPASRPAARQVPPAFAPVTDEPGLPRVLLIGDSISIGYTPAVQQKLKGVANVHRIPENGGPTTRGIEKIEAWLGKDHWDVIHFNWGLHDLKRLEPDRCQVPLEEYEANLRRLVSRLKQTEAVLVWATTTPVPAAAQQRDPADVPRYAQAALRVMRENEVLIDDLHAFAQPRLAEIQLPKNVHYTRDGYTQLAEPVAASIRDALKMRRGTSTAPAAASSPVGRVGARRTAATQPAGNRVPRRARSGR